MLIYNIYFQDSSSTINIVRSSWSKLLWIKPMLIKIRSKTRLMESFVEKVSALSNYKMPKNRALT